MTQRTIRMPSLFSLSSIYKSGSYVGIQHILTGRGKIGGLKRVHTFRTNNA